ncbi:12258_t:CDS:2 [Gigaspora rosea]|nr:12258_t:CDS:2 [Gigaspora rosea]
MPTPISTNPDTIDLDAFYAQYSNTIPSSPIQEHIPCIHECHKCKEPVQCTKSIKENHHFLNNNAIFYSNNVYYKKCLSDLSQTIQPLTTTKDN